MPTSLARAFSLATRAAVAESSGRVKLLSTASGCATGGGSLGSTSRARTVSVLPDTLCTMTLATRLPVASTGTAPIACHFPGVDAMKCSGSPAIAPRIETMESARSVGALSVSRTIAPGSGRAGATERRGVCAPSDPEKRAQSATNRTETGGRKRRHLHRQVEAIAQRPGQPAAIAQHLLRRAAAFPHGVAGEPARARVHRPHEHEPGGEERRPRRPRDRDASFFERLAQHLEHVAAELEHLVEEEHAVVGEAHFAGPRLRSAADERRVRDRVMRCAKRPRRRSGRRPPPEAPQPSARSSPPAPRRR